MRPAFFPTGPDRFSAACRIEGGEPLAKASSAQSPLPFKRSRLFPPATRKFRFRPVQKSPGLKAAFPSIGENSSAHTGEPAANFAARIRLVGRFRGTPDPQRRPPDKKGNRPVPDRLERRGTFFCFPSFPSAGDSRLFSKRQALDPAFPVKEERGFHPPQDG